MINLRKVEYKDSKKIWEWRNDPNTRKMFANSEVISWKSHKKWFEEIIKSENSMILLAYKDDLDIGMVRFDFKSSNAAEVSLNFNPDARGKGYGNLVLNESLKIANAKGIRNFSTIVRKENFVAMKVWTKSNFITNKEDDKFFYLDLSF